MMIDKTTSLTFFCPYRRQDAISQLTARKQNESDWLFRLLRAMFPRLRKCFLYPRHAKRNVSTLVFW